MKPFNRFSVMTTLIAAMALSGCKDDVYDPDKIRQIPPAGNPFGENFKAPDGFDWSMNLSLKLNVEVKDEFAGQYDYLIEAFTLNPFYSTTATPIAAGYAKKNQNYTTEISLAKSISLLYIRVTDPKLRNAVYEYTVPENGGTLDCKLYYTATNTRAAFSIGTSGWDKVSSQIKKYDIEEKETVLTGMTENREFMTGSSDRLKDNSVYIIKQGDTFNSNLTNDGKGATVIVNGTWNMTSTSTPQGLNIYVAKGGRITGAPQIGNNCALEIQDGGAVDCQSFTTQTNIPVRNFGTFSVTGTSKFNTGSSLYNAKNAKVSAQELDLEQANITIVNFGTFQAKSIDNFNSGVVYNAEDAVFELTGDIEAYSSQVLNHGKMRVDGIIQTNSNLSTIIANYRTGVFIANEFKGGGIFINDNYLELNKFDVTNHTEAILYNNCALIAKQLFKFTQAVIDHGSVTGPRNDDSWKNVPVESYSSGSIKFKNGSIIKASTFECGSNLNINAEGDNPSMIQAEKITYSWTTKLAGNLLLDIDEEVNAGKQGQSGAVDSQCNKSSTVKTTIPSGTAQESIETCSGIIYPGNGGSDTPETQELPETGDNQSYTYAFEDQWPIYGDYDMNDVVLTIDETKFTVKKENGDEYVQEMKIEGRVKAVGASRTLGIGIQFLGLNNSVKTSELKQNGKLISFEDGNDHPTLIVCEDAHRYMDSSQTDNTFINTEIGGKTDEAKNFNFSIKFDGQDVKPENLTIDKLDVFIYCKKDTHIPYRREIHLAGYAPTAYADQSFSGAGNDNGKNEFTSNENLAWGIRIPSNEWSWPQEYIMIKNVYRDFEAWVTSGGTSGTDWWNNNNVDTSKLYQK